MLSRKVLSQTKPKCINRNPSAIILHKDLSSERGCILFSYLIPSSYFYDHPSPFFQFSLGMPLLSTPFNLLGQSFFLIVLSCLLDPTLFDVLNEMNNDNVSSTVLIFYYLDDLYTNAFISKAIVGNLFKRISAISKLTKALQWKPSFRMITQSSPLNLTLFDFAVLAAVLNHLKLSAPHTR